MKQSLGKTQKQPAGRTTRCCQQWIPSSPLSSPHISLLPCRITGISLLLPPYFSTSFEPPPPRGSLLCPPWEGLSGYRTPLCWAPPGAEGGSHDEYVHPESAGKVSICCSTAEIAKQKFFLHQSWSKALEAFCGARSPTNCKVQNG